MKRVLLFTFMAAFMCAAQVSAKELRKIVNFVKSYSRLTRWNALTAKIR